MQHLLNHHLGALLGALTLSVPTFAAAQGATQEPESLLKALEARQDLTVLRSLLGKAEIAPESPITLIAPRDAAFEGVAAPAEMAVLKALLLSHVAPRGGSAVDLVKLGAVPTAAGIGFQVTIEDGVVAVGGARVVSSIGCGDGSMLHVVDRVLSHDDAARITESGRKQVQSTARTLEEALDAADKEGVRDVVLRAVSELAMTAPGHAYKLLNAAIDQSLDAAALDDELRSVIDNLVFEPVREAETPPDFPPFALVDEVVLKSYPRYRMAVATMDGARDQRTPFFTLFNHIKKNKVEMTAPVQMDYDDSNESAKMMAFLYETPDQGETGLDGSVKVIDVAPIMAISIGARGYDSDRRVDALKQRLTAWLATHPGYEAAGPMRTMGYNGPGVMGGRRFFEVELPVRPVSDAND